MTTAFDISIIDQPLDGKSLVELNAIKASIDNEVEALKAKKTTLTKEERSNLDDITEFLPELLAAIDKLKPSAQYVPTKGTEEMVHLKLRRARRFDSVTGEEVSPLFTQMYTYAEWQLFKTHHRALGYFIVNVLWDPYNEAKADE